MDSDLILDLFDSEWRFKVRQFEFKLTLYDKDTFEDDYFTYACNLARIAKTKILESHYEALERLHKHTSFDNDAFKKLENALSCAIENIDVDMKFVSLDMIRK